MSVTETITNQPIVTSIYTTTCDSVSPEADTEDSECAICLSEEEYLELMEGSEYDEDYDEEEGSDLRKKK